jgi:hypothetical protein
MDHTLWYAGKAVAKAPDPMERDFLKGMHQAPVLKQLASHLAAATNQTVRLMSIWLDARDYVSWPPPTAVPAGVLPAGAPLHELADLAVIVRRYQPGKDIDRWMWLVQAKRTVAGAFETYTGQSSAAELELLQTMPSFRMKGVSPDFDLHTIDFAHQPALVPWTFLDFDKSLTNPLSANAQFNLPVAARWLGGVAPTGSWGAAWPHPTMSLASYTSCLEAIIKRQPTAWTPAISSGGTPSVLTAPNFFPGAPIGDGTCPEWTRLYWNMATRGRHKKHGYARTSAGNFDGSVIQQSFMTMDLTARLAAAPGLWPGMDSTGYSLTVARAPAPYIFSCRFGGQRDFDPADYRGAVAMAYGSQGPNLELLNAFGVEEERAAAEFQPTTDGRGHDAGSGSPDFPHGWPNDNEEDPQGQFVLFVDTFSPG